MTAAKKRPNKAFIKGHAVIPNAALSRIKSGLDADQFLILDAGALVSRAAA
jgi:hypothetical protein